MKLHHFQKFVVSTVTSGKPISCSGGVFAEWKGRFFSFESRPGLAETVLILLLGVRTGWEFLPENRWKCLSYLFTPGDREARGRFTGNQGKGWKWYGEDFGEVEYMERERGMLAGKRIWSVLYEIEKWMSRLKSDIFLKKAMQRVVSVKRSSEKNRSNWRYFKKSSYPSTLKRSSS